MQTKSYYGIVYAGKGFLLGGVKKHISSHFSCSKEASDWAEVVKVINQIAGRDVKRIVILPSEYLPEIESDSIS